MPTSISPTEAPSRLGVTLALADAAQSLRWEGLPADVRELAHQCLLDWLGVTLAGSGAALVARLLAQADAEGGHPIASVPGTGRRLAPQQAALVNGTASHVLDYDVNTGMHGHVSAPVLGALLPLAQQQGASGRDLLTAFVAGYELACRAGRVLREVHDAGVPATDIAAQGERLANKFGRLAAPVLGDARAGALLAQVAGLEAGSARELMEQAAGGPAAGA